MPGKTFECMSLAKEFVGIVKHVTGRDLTVASSIGGSAAAVAFITTYDSLAEMEELLPKLMASAEYQTALKKAEHIVVPGSTHDQIWRSF